MHGVGSVISLRRTPFLLNVSNKLRVVASSSDDFSIRVWEVKSGQTVLGPLLSHTKGFTCIAFSPCGRYIAAVSEDHTVSIWKMENGSPQRDAIDEHTESESLPTHEYNVEVHEEYSVDASTTQNDMLPSSSKVDSFST